MPLDPISWVLQAVSAAFALSAGIYWLRSSQTEIPDKINNMDYGTIGGDRTEAEDDDLDKLTSGLTKQSALSAKAAFCACISAVSQAIYFILSFF